MVSDSGEESEAQRGEIFGMRCGFVEDVEPELIHFHFMTKLWRSSHFSAPTVAFRPITTDITTAKVLGSSWELWRLWRVERVYSIPVVIRGSEVDDDSQAGPQGSRKRLGHTVGAVQKPIRCSSAEDF
jgi:hypothetical protein